MRIVSDESVDYGIVKSLREKGFDVLSITDDYSGSDDVSVLKYAVGKDSLLITEDKDFGELAYRFGYEHRGIMLIRLSDLPRKERIPLAAEAVSTHYELLKGNFSVLNSRGLRIKKKK